MDRHRVQKKVKNQANHSILACKKDYYRSYFGSNIGKIKPTWSGINLAFYICQERKPKPRFRSWLLMTKTPMILTGSVLLLIVISRKLDQLYAWPQRLIPMSQFRDNF